MDAICDSAHTESRENGYLLPQYVRNLLPKPISWRVRQLKLVAALKTAWTDTVYITRSLLQRWKAILANLFALGLIAGLAVCIFELTVSLPVSQELQYCVPGGDFNLYHKYNPFSLSHAFQITLSFGRFTFSQAKTIDVAWDIVIGRGGQAILAYFTFRIFSGCLTRLLERQGFVASYQTFQAVVFREISLTSTWKLCANIRKNMRARDITAMSWMAIATGYVVAFPTWLSAMTGYTSTVRPYIETHSGSQVAWENRRALYQIHDGERINRTKDYIVGADGLGYAGYYDDGDNLIWDCADAFSFDDEGSTAIWYDAPPSCAFAWNVSSYVSRHGSSTVLNEASIFNATHHLTSPTLNITAFNTTLRTTIGGYWYDSEVYRFSMGPANQTSNLAAPLPLTYTVNNELYDEDYVIANTNCINESSYTWGFSFLTLFVFLIVTTVWVIGMYATHLDTFWNSRLDTIPRCMGFLRGVSDVSKAMKMDDLHAEEVDGEAELRSKLGSKEGEISYAWFEMEGLISRKEGLRVWRKGVKSLNGWRESWTSLQWVWIAILFVLGLPFWAIPMRVPVPWLFDVVLLLVGLWGQSRRWWKERGGVIGKRTYSEIDGEVEMAATPRPLGYEKFDGDESGESSVVKPMRSGEIRQEEERETP